MNHETLLSEISQIQKLKSSKHIQYIKEMKVELLWLRAVRDVKPAHL